MCHLRQFPEELSLSKVKRRLFDTELNSRSRAGGELREFGLMRKSYLENYRRGIYSGLLLSRELKKHLLMMQEQAEERFDSLVEQMARQEGVTEQLKTQEQMLWGG